MAVLPLLLLAACGGGKAQGNGLLTKPVAAPDVSGPALDGSGTVAVKQAGTITVVNLFGGWCVPCRAETPALVAAAKARPRIRFVGIDVLESRADGRRFVADHAVPYPVIFDGDGTDLARFPGVNPSAVPSTLVIDGHGQVVARWIGRVGSDFTAVLDQVAARA